MPFEKVDTQIDFPAQERAILDFWQRIGAFEKLRAKNRGKPKWSFLDGPITVGRNPATAGCPFQPRGPVIGSCSRGS